MQAGALLGLILVFGMAVPSTPSEGEQAQYQAVSDDVVQSRLQLYKGNDSVREAALKQLLPMSVAEYYDSYRLLAAYLAVLDLTPVPQPHVCTARPVR